MGQGRGVRHTLSALHLLPGHGHCAFQSVPSVLVPSSVSPFDHPGLLEVDTPHGDMFHVNILVPLWLLPGLAEYSNLAASNNVRAGLPYHHDALARANHLVTLGHVDQ